jgi:hypothetical protein
VKTPKTAHGDWKSLDHALGRWPSASSPVSANGGKGATMADDRHRLAALRVTRFLGASALLVVGGVHLEQYTVAHFSAIPTIGPLFLVNFIAASSLGLLLLIPIGHSVHRGRLLLDSLAALAGIGVAVGALAALLISEHTRLFGFMEHGYRLEIVIAIASEVVVIVSFGVFLVVADRWGHELRERAPARGESGQPRSAPKATGA